MLVKVSNNMLNVFYLLGTFFEQSVSEFKAMNPVINIKKA